MKKYEYKFIEVKIETEFDVQQGDTFEKCKNIVQSETQAGWKLNQIVIPYNEKFGIGGVYCYQIILEKEIE
ncbi:MAG: DUF4177 domain-containing protein [Oscillospiraceae bacterium]